MEKSITIKDIARKFKCSPSTVSRALNGHPAINIETRHTISEYAQKMGYQKNAVSLSLLNQSTHTIGLIIPSTKYFHENAIVEGIQSVLEGMGYMLVVCITNEQLVNEKKHIERLLAHRVDALLVSIAHETYQKQDFTHFYTAQNRKIPIVFIDRAFQDENFSSVTVDDYRGAFLATQHLVDTGCKKIAFLSGPSSLYVCKQRLNGFLDCLLNNQISIKKHWIIETNFDSTSAMTATQHLFANAAHPDGIFCASDNMAYGVMQTLNGIKKQFPKDVAIVGFDDAPTSQFFNPSLTTINRKSVEVGCIAANLALQILEGTVSTNSKIILTPSLICRQTTANV